MRPTYLTREGYNKLKEELDFLKGPKRREISRQIGEARAHGDISENAEYDAAKEAQAHLERRVAELESKLANIRIIEDENFPDDKVYIGARVKLFDIQSDTEVCYMLVSPEEADYKTGKISTVAPVGKALLGREVGDTVEVRTPNGIRQYEIIEISR
ncbi:transcription elongation factor GreA [bacterium]|nr:transcription elongation factor GreA [bacterium]